MKDGTFLSLSTFYLRFADKTFRDATARLVSSIIPAKNKQRLS
jgi:hypothetical protein